MRNAGDYAIGIIAAISFISAIAQLLTTRWDEVSRAVRIRRNLLVTAFLGAGLIAAIVSVRQPQGVATTTVETVGQAGSLSTAPDTTSATTISTATTAATTASNTTIANLTTHGVTSPPPGHPQSALPQEPVIRDTTGQSVTQLVSAAKSAIDTTRHRVEGTLSSDIVVESDERLQGMVTANMSLDITVTTRGALTTTFTIESRGGGFTEAAALNQARGRLAAKLRERLRQEVPQ